MMKSEPEATSGGDQVMTVSGAVRTEVPHQQFRAAGRLIMGREPGLSLLKSIMVGGGGWGSKPAIDEGRLRAVAC